MTTPFSIKIANLFLGLILLLTLPFEADALMMDVKKPTRGNYQSVGNEKEALINRLRAAYDKKPVEKSALSYKRFRIAKTTLITEIPTTWKYAVERTILNKDETRIYPLVGPTNIWIVSQRMSKDYSMQDLNEKFAHDTAPTETLELSSHYLPSASNIQKKDITVGSTIPALRFDYEVDWDGKQVGSAVLFAKGSE